MKHIPLIICIILVTSSLTSAQGIKSGKPDSRFENFFKKYTQSKKNNSDLFKYQNQSMPSASPGLYTEEKSIDNMPNAYSKQPLLNYMGNNNKGFSLYQSGIDNLYVLKPDSSFFSAMPVK